MQHRNGEISESCQFPTRRAVVHMPGYEARENTPMAKTAVKPAGTGGYEGIERHSIGVRWEIATEPTQYMCGCSDATRVISMSWIACVIA